MHSDLSLAFAAELPPRQTASAALLTLALAGLVLGCVSLGATPHASLYSRIGGMPTIFAVVDETIDTLAAHPRAGRSLHGVRLPALKQDVAVRFCALSGGPCRIDYDHVNKAHGGLKLRDADFDLMVGALRRALDHRVGERERNELLRLLAPVKRAMVTA